MKNLKKALARQDPRKYNKSRIEISGVKHSAQFKDIEEMVMKKRDKPAGCESIEDGFKKIVEGNFSNGEIQEVPKLSRELHEKYNEFYPEEASSVALHRIIELLRSLAKMEEGAIFKKCIELTCQAVLNHAREQESKEKAKCLDEFNKLLKTILPGQKKEEPDFTKKAHPKKMNTSATSLKIKVTRDEYHIEEDNPLKRKKSLDFKNKSKVSSNSNKNLSGNNRLQQFFKETNVKLVKTKIEYDFSAIFEASHNNIQPRNRTLYVEPKSEKETGKGRKQPRQEKKDEGFVFYRPYKKH